MQQFLVRLAGRCLPFCTPSPFTLHRLLIALSKALSFSVTKVSVSLGCLHLVGRTEPQTQL